MKTLKVLGLLALVVLLGAFSSKFTSTDAGYGIGDTATDFSLKNVDGKMVSLSDFENAKGFLVIFTCNTCPYSVAYEGRINALDAKYKPLGVPVIAINPNNPEKKPGDSFAAMKTELLKKDLPFHICWTKVKKYIRNMEQQEHHMCTYWKKLQNGNVVKYIGAIDDNSRDASEVEEKFVENAVDSMLAGKEIKTTTTRAIGCSIKV